MQEPITVQMGKFVRNINEKRKEMQYSKKWFIKTFGWPDVVNSSVKNMCIRFVTLTRIAKKECVCQTLQRSLRYLRVNSIQVAYDHASFVDVRGTLEQTVGGGFNLHFAIAAGIWKKKMDVHRKKIYLDTPRY